MSADIRSALIDVVLWLYRAFFIPGDRLLAQFPQLDAIGQGRWASGLLSTAVWLAAVLAIVLLYRFIRDVDRALTAILIRIFEELRRAGRVVARRLTIALRAYALERQARLSRTEVSELPALTALQLHVLQAHANLQPAHLLTPSDVARGLDMRASDVEKVLATLRKLSLVDRTLGAGDGEDGYRLTRAGEVLLAACNRAQPEPRISPSREAVRPKRIEPRLGSA